MSTVTPADAPAGLTVAPAGLSPFYPHTPEGKPAFAPRMAAVVGHEFPDTAWWEAGDMKQAEGVLGRADRGYRKEYKVFPGDRA